MKTTDSRMDDVAHEDETGTGTPGQGPRFIKANLGVIMLVTVAVIIGAAAVSWTRTPVFTSIAEVIVQPRSYTSGSAAQLPDMATEKALASSGTVLGTASRALGVSADQLAQALSITVPVDTRVLRIAYAYPNALEARRRAQGIAAAYVADANQNEPAAQPHAAIITGASLPESPSSPKHVIDLGVGLLLGLVLGLGIGLIRDRRDDSFRSLSDFEAYVGAPVIGVIPALARGATKTGAGLLTIVDTDADAVGAYSDLRTRLLQIAERRSAKTVLVASPAGDDKAAIATNLATRLAMSGLHVALVFADVRPSGVLNVLGIGERAGLTDLAHGDVVLAQALCETGVSGLQVVTAGSTLRDPGVLFQARTMKQTLEELRDNFDFIVFAAPPVLAGADTSVLAASVDMVLLVGDARRSTRSEVAAAAHQLEPSRKKLIGGVLDNVGKRRPWTRLRRPRITEGMASAPPPDSGLKTRSWPWSRRRPSTDTAKRTTWVIREDGTVRKVYPDTTLKDQADRGSPGAKKPVSKAVRKVYPDTTLKDQADRGSPGAKKPVSKADGPRPAPNEGTP